MPIHPIAPLVPEGACILILGSFPSVKSREDGFYYAHPQNRFWRLLPRLFKEEEPGSREEKIQFLQRHKIALWDVIASCEIHGSSDASITNVVPNDLTPILQKEKIKAVFCNGKTSWNLYKKYQEPVLHLSATALPSTSPANASFTLERLQEAWKAILAIL